MNCTESPVFPFDNWVLGNSWKISIYTYYIYIYLLLYVYYCCHEKENKGNPKWKQMPWMDMHASVHTSTCWRHWTIRGALGRSSWTTNQTTWILLWIDTFHIAKMFFQWLRRESIQRDWTKLRIFESAQRADEAMFVMFERVCAA
jgi:hypothetical protein